MRSLLKQQFWEVLQGVAPLITVANVLQLLLARAPAEVFLRFVVGSTLAMAGLTLLYTGVERGILPMGRYVGAELPSRGSLKLAIGVVFAFSFATTLAEPDVLVLAREAAAMAGSRFSAPVLVTLVGIGVGVFAAIALVRVVFGTSMVAVLAAVYVPIAALSLFARTDVVPLAFDAGSVTTGVLTAPVVLAIAGGFASVLADRNVDEDGFGYLGLASTGPILVMLLVGMLS